jgi:arsenate reductase (glutaredoxin)
LLEEHNIEHSYREYKKNPLDLEELQDMILKMGVPANTLLRKRDKAYKELSLTGKEDDATLLPLFAEYPTLMQRPIFIHKSKAVLGRPIENMLTIV